MNCAQKQHLSLRLYYSRKKDIQSFFGLFKQFTDDFRISKIKGTNDPFQSHAIVLSKQLVKIPRWLLSTLTLYPNFIV